MTGPPSIPGSFKEDVKHLTYYHPNLRNMDQVKEKMVQFMGEDGRFLLRNSFSKLDALTFSVMHERSIKHFNVLRQQGTAGFKYYVQDCSFSSIDQLVSYYRATDVPNQEGVNYVRLLKPITNIAARPLPSPNTRTLPVRAPGNNSIQPRQWQSVHEKSHNNQMMMRDRQSSESGLDNDAFVSEWSQSNGSNHSYGSRPPAPLPDEPAYDHSRYCRVPNIMPDRASELVELLREQDRRFANQRCECGLTYEEAQLPEGWTMHISREQLSNGRLFFTSPNGDTSWELPTDIALRLTNDEKEKIIKYKSKDPSVRRTGSNLSMQSGVPTQHNEQTGSSGTTTGSSTTS